MENGAFPWPCRGAERLGKKIVIIARSGTWEEPEKPTDPGQILLFTGTEELQPSY